MKMVSTSFTLFLKIVFPVFWIVFFGSFTTAIFFTEDLTSFFGIPIGTFKYILLVFFLFGIVLLYWMLMRIKRVEMDEKFVYATNYFKNYRYPWHNIENIEERDFIFFRVIYVHLKTPGNFGKKITFVASREKLNTFMETYPHLFEAFA